MDTGAIIAKQVDKVFVVDFYEGTLDIIVPRITALLLDLPCALKEGRHGTGNDTHTICRIRWIGVKVNACHGEGLARAGLAVCEDCAIKAVEKAGEEWEGGGSEERMLGALWRVDLVEGEDLFFGVCGCGRAGGRGGAGTRC